MKPKIILSIALLTSVITYSQSKNDLTVYYDSVHKVTTKQNHQFYRIIKDYKLDKQSYQIQEFYKSGKLYSEVKSLKKDIAIRDGLFVSYYENGNISKQINYIEGVPEGKNIVFFENGNKYTEWNHTKGRINGKRFVWHKNGNKRLEEEYIEGVKVGRDIVWYENGSKKLEGEYIKEDKNYKSYHKINQFWDENGVQKVFDGNGLFSDQNGSEYAKGELKNGIKIGVWEGKINETGLEYKEIYDLGKLVSGESIDTAGNKYSYTEFKTDPKPKRGFLDFYDFVNKNLIKTKPKEEKRNSYIRLEVNEKGETITPGFKTFKGHNIEEIIKIMKSYEGFIPAKQRGQPVHGYISFPFTDKSSN